MTAPDGGTVVFITETYPNAANVINAETRGPRGVAGPEGPQGPVGPQGPIGPSGIGVLVERHFAAASTTWVINHGLDTYPTVTLYDLNDESVEGAISAPDRNTVIVRWDLPMSGTARLNS